MPVNNISELLAKALRGDDNALSQWEQTTLLKDFKPEQIKEALVILDKYLAENEPQKGIALYLRGIWYEYDIKEYDGPNPKFADRNYPKAIEFYTKAMRLNIIPAIKRRAYLHERGLGGDTNYSQAQKLYEKAKELGDTTVGRDLERVKEEEKTQEEKRKEQEEHYKKRIAQYDATLSADNADALYKKAYQLLEGLKDSTGRYIGGPESYKKAEIIIILLERASYLGHVNAKAVRALMHERGIGAEQNTDAAIKLYEEVIPFDTIMPMINRANLHLAGAGGPVNVYEAFKLYEQASELGSSNAKQLLERLRERIKRQNDRYQKEMMQHEKGIALDDDYAMYYCGLMYLFGIGCDVNYPKAAVLFDKASLHDNVEAMKSRARMHLKGQGGSRNYFQAMKLLEKASELGDIGAKRELEWQRKQKDRLLNQALNGNHTALAEWLNYSAQKAFNEQEIEQSLKTIQKDLDQEDQGKKGFALYLRALWYEHGIGSDKNDFEAMTLLDKACELNNAHALKRRGDYFRKEKNYFKAQEFYKKAISLGYEEAKVDLQLVEASLRGIKRTEIIQQKESRYQRLVEKVISEIETVLTTLRVKIDEIDKTQYPDAQRKAQELLNNLERHKNSYREALLRSAGASLATDGQKFRQDIESEINKASILAKDLGWGEYLEELKRAQINRTLSIPNFFELLDQVLNGDHTSLVQWIDATERKAFNGEIKQTLEIIEQHIGQEEDKVKKGFALYLRALWYEHGIGTKKDLSAAVQLYDQASQLDNSYALYAKAQMSQRERNYPKYVEFLNKAIELGNNLALCAKADLYLYGGLGVAKEESKAIALLEQAARQGDVAAMYRRAAIYEEERDFPNAIAFYNKIKEVIAPNNFSQRRELEGKITLFQRYMRQEEEKKHREEKIKQILQATVQKQANAQQPAEGMEAKQEAEKQRKALEAQQAAEKQKALEAQQAAEKQKALEVQQAAEK